MPGKFEGEPDYVQGFWHDAMMGGSQDYSDEYGTLYSEIKIVNQERDLWPDLGNAEYIVLWEDEQGFVTHELFDSQDDLEDWYDEMGIDF